MAQSKTAKQILQAAETLFAEQGFAGTTMRQITRAANVNLAAVNYHFGSKQGLIQSVAEQFMRPLSQFLTEEMAERLTVNDSVSMEELMEMLMRALLHVNEENHFALPMFTRLLDLAYMKNQEELRDFLVGRYHSKLNPFIELIRAGSAPMEDDEFFWRLHFLMGSVVFTLSNYHTLTAIEKRKFDSQAEVEMILHRIIPVLTAGLQARADKHMFCRI